MSCHAIIPTRIPRRFSYSYDLCWTNRNYSAIRATLQIFEWPSSYDCCWTWPLRMRIEIVVNKRNMSESSSKRGPKRRFTDSERKHRKGASNAKLGKSRICIVDQCDRWNKLISVLRVKTNAEVAKIILDW